MLIFPVILHRGVMLCDALHHRARHALLARHRHRWPSMLGMTVGFNGLVTLGSS